jgi:hypothetical protein
MKQFIASLTQFLMVCSIPAIIFVSSYLYFDPFRVLWHYDNYSYADVVSNRDFVSTTMFINNQKKNNYNSFIFGSSRTLAFRPDTWRKYLSDDAKPFAFDASNESVYGIYTKLKYLDSTNVEIKNALILLCRDVSFGFSEESKGHLFIKHPATTTKNNLDFQLQFFKAYLAPKFLFSFYCYKMIGVYKPFMSGYIENRKIAYGRVTNEIDIVDEENEILKNPTAYYAAKIFPTRAINKTDSRQINKKGLFMIKEIKRLLEKNNTNYRVVLSPLYDQVKFNPSDLFLLRKEFGNKLFDFTGKNSFTESKTNYYEKNHFRPIVGDSIFKIIYKAPIR